MDIWTRLYGNFENKNHIKEQINSKDTVSTEALGDVIDDVEETETPMDEPEVDSDEETTEVPGEETPDEDEIETDPVEEEELPADDEPAEDFSDDTEDIDPEEEENVEEEPIEAPETAHPDQEINGKIHISKQILNLLDDIKRSIDQFNDAPLENKSIVVNKLLELQRIVQSLSEIVNKASIADLQLRYGIAVRTFEEIIKM